jgi:RNA polymerase sigma factor (sigma-70 family)
VSPHALPPQQPEGAPPGKPGRKLGPILPGVGAAHRKWLEPLRDRFLDSGMTVGEVADQTGWAKSKVSELLRGAGLYPRWEITHGLLTAFGLPIAPMQRLWAEAAREASKNPRWIDGCIGERGTRLRAARPADRGPGETGRLRVRQPSPLTLHAFAELRCPDYLGYARVFLTRTEDAVEAVQEALDLLCDAWDRAVSSPNLNAYAWTVLRRAVMRRVPRRGGRPDLSAAAFETEALGRAVGSEARFAQLEESLRLFEAMGGLPGEQLDVMVLRHLRALPEERVASVLGVPVAAVRSALRHARRYVMDVLDPQQPATEGRAS